MKVTITVSGAESVLEKLNKLETIENPIMEGLREVIDEAEEIATYLYTTQVGENEWDSSLESGNADFHAEIIEMPNGYTLRMSGEDVGFLEFGAGVLTTEDEFAQEVGYDVSPWSYSGNDRGFWRWKHKRYTGLTPTRGMQAALDYIRDHVVDVVQRKIDEWIGN